MFLAVKMVSYVSSASLEFDRPSSECHRTATTTREGTETYSMTSVQQIMLSTEEAERGSIVWQFTTTTTTTTTNTTKAPAQPQYK